jgi:hypothetical protein
MTAREKVTFSGEPVPENHCSVCGYKTNAATGAPSSGQHRPSPGDLTICLKCGELSQFDENMRLVSPSLDAMLQLDAEQMAEITLAQKLIRKKRLIR